MDEPGAAWMPSSKHFMGRAGHTARWIIIHGTAGFASAEAVARYFQQVESSTHYIIGQDGMLIQVVAEADAAWGNGGVSRGHDPWWSPNLNPNYVTISIEHHKLRRDNADELTEPQKLASFRLIKHICERHHIPQRRADARGGITGHYSMDPAHRSYCPGPYPWNELFAFLHHATSHTNPSETPNAPATTERQQIDALREQNASLQAAIGALEAQVAGLQSVSADFQRQLTNLRIERDALQR